MWIIIIYLVVAMWFMHQEGTLGNDLGVAILLSLIWPFTVSLMIVGTVIAYTLDLFCDDDH